MGQIAKLYLRGKLVNQLIANLSEDEQRMVENLVLEVIEDPEIQKAMSKVADALRVTIKNEYMNKDCGVQEARLAVWRAAASALFYKIEPKVLTVEQDRRKFFKEWIYNYLRQILRENKLPAVSVQVPVYGPAHEIAEIIIEDTLEKIKFNGKQLDTEKVRPGDGVTAYFLNTLAIPLAKMKKLWALQARYEKHGVKIEFGSTSIWMHYPEEQFIEDKISKSYLLKLNSFEAGDPENEESFRYQMEYSVVDRKGEKDMSFVLRDSIERVKKLVSDDEVATKIVQIYLDPPEEYTDQYGEVSPSGIAKFLDVPNKKVKKALNKLQVSWMAVGDLK